MQNSSTFRLLLHQEYFEIPSSFQRLSEIKQNIYENLMMNKEYIIKSEITKDILLNFIKYWTKNEIPEITFDNIDQYDLISNEFDIMKNIIQLSRKIFQNPRNFLSVTKNKQLKNKITDKKKLLFQENEKYHQIIQNLFCNSKLESEIDFLEINDKLFLACEKGDANLVDILVKKGANYNGSLFKINEDDKTAGIFSVLKVEKTQFIVKSCYYDDEEYLLTDIYQNTFKKTPIQTIEFAEDSNLLRIGKASFLKSSIEQISIPASVYYIGENAFFKCRRLKIVEFAENSELKIIDKNAFSQTSIERITIPSNVIHIKESAFDNCDNLVKIEFSQNSKLKTIEKNAFKNCCELTDISLPSNVDDLKDGWCNDIGKLTNISISPNTNGNIQYFDDKYIIGKSENNGHEYDVLLFARRDIEKAVIPSFIKKIGPHSFEMCDNLKEISFSEDSQLLSIGHHAFCRSSLEKLFIPPNFIDFDNECFSSALRIKDLIISPNNKNLCVLNNNFLLGKSINNSEDYDVLLFARRDIVEATIPSFIKKIAPYSFENCRDLRKVIFTEDSKLLSIGHHAFSNSSLESIIIPSSVVHIDEHAFSYCGYLKNFEFSKESNISMINKFTFLYSGLFSLSIPSSISYFPSGWCKDLNYLKDITVYPSKEQNIIYYDNSFILGKSDVNSNVYDVLIYARRNIEIANIPSFIKQISPYAFENCSSLFVLSFPDQSELQIIDKYAFYKSKIQFFVIPPSVQIIGKYAFAYCDKLKNVYSVENSNLQIIGKFAFYSSALESIDIPESVIRIEECAFSYCQRLEKVGFFVGSHLEIIGKEAFQSSGINTMIIPASVTRIDKSAFAVSNITNFGFEQGSNIQIIGPCAFYLTFIIGIIFPPSLIRICKSAFHECQMAEGFEFRGNSRLQYIDENAFYHGSLQLIDNFPSTCRVIGNSAFFLCSVFDTLIIPENSKLKLIGNYAFYQTIIESISNISNVEKIGEFAFENCARLENIDFGADSKLKTIERGAFSCCLFKKITIPSQVSMIGEYAFRDCFKLKTVNIPNDSLLTSFDNCLFYNSAIECLDVPGSISELIDGWCYLTPYLTKLNLMPENKCFTTYGDFVLGKLNEEEDDDDFNSIVFANRNIENAIIPSFVIHLAPGAFDCCCKLQKIEFSKDSKLKFIEEYALSYTSIKKIRIPSTVIEIAPYAFYGCGLLNIVEFDEDSELESIGAQSFEKSCITGLFIPPSVQEISKDAFSNCHFLRLIEFHENSKLDSFDIKIVENLSDELIIYAPKELSKLFIND